MLTRPARCTSRALAFALALSLAACSSISVGYDYDPGASFEGLHSFTWRPFEGPTVGNRVVSPLLEKAIRETVSDELRTRGYRETDSGADFTVSGLAVVNQRVDVEYVDNAWGDGRRSWYVPGGTRTWVTTYDEGTLVLDIASGRTSEPLWRGTATAIVDNDQTPEERRARLREAVQKVLANFPPQR